MGFSLNRNYILLFEDTDLEGAEVKLRATPVGVPLKIRNGLGDEEIAALLADYVVSWNLDGLDGEPLPITAEAIIDNLEASVVALIVRHWMDAATGVTAPLDGRSTSGGQSLEVNIPMAEL